MTSSTLVSFRHVRKSRQQVTALKNFNRISPPENWSRWWAAAAAVNRRCYGCWWALSLPPGDICINGEPVTGVGKERGIVFQEPRLFRGLTCSTT